MADCVRQARAAVACAGPGGGVRGGGKDLGAFRKVFLFGLEIGDVDEPSGVGGRVYVRFAHAPEPVAWQLYRVIRREFLSLFNV